MTEPCCPLHTNTCGHLDYCCQRCPALGDGSNAQLLMAAFGGVLLLVLFALGVS